MTCSVGKLVSCLFFISSSQSQRLKIRPRFYLHEHQRTDLGERVSDGVDGAVVEVREFFLLFLFCCCLFTPITKSALLNFTREGQDLGENAVLFFVSAWSLTCDARQLIRVVGLRWYRRLGRCNNRQNNLEFLSRSTRSIPRRRQRCSPCFRLPIIFW